jgi:hypothetical protein
MVILRPRVPAQHSARCYYLVPSSSQLAPALGAAAEKRRHQQRQRQRPRAGGKRGVGERRDTSQFCTAHAANAMVKTLCSSSSRKESQRRLVDHCQEQFCVDFGGAVVVVIAVSDAQLQVLVLWCLFGVVQLVSGFPVWPGHPCTSPSAAACCCCCCCPDVSR